ncbi:hypothetical protein LP090_04015 [Moraxella bovis]|uniref:hypothetical protein n=1 Tax=Moraxella bovis TaxID=476 RepID=UPI0022274678|nr:hypothetical protein [Moraxella bovis]UYZ67832.1 hypothetical protein LP122_08585 [Moraxella bovis]UYZ70207.1 hypothetical protein LP089_08690 [Moraxella bovis]UYZ73884.1 hypothetical protein LP105_04040 [Moraxella bovis]UZA13505.1 hypothetical protein LP102_08745 [Moraxella bovis]UZA28139.1 hypothetical protein LP119_04015 [Moraxella bovis]
MNQLPKLATLTFGVLSVAKYTTDFKLSVIEYYLNHHSYTLQNEKAPRFFVRGELCLLMTETDLQASLWRTENLVQHTF